MLGTIVTVVEDPSTKIASNYYEILGICKTATVEEIKRAYKKEALFWHPDKVSPESKEIATAHFQRLQEAYSTLIDPKKRFIYDNNLSSPLLAPYVSGRSVIVKSKNGISVTSEGEAITDLLKNEKIKTHRVVKASLQPFLKRFEGDLERLIHIAFEIDDGNILQVKNKKYETVATNMRNLYIQINICIYVLQEEKPTYDEVIEVLKSCQGAITQAQETGDFAVHRGFFRTTPIFKSLCAGMDALSNIFSYLIQAITRRVNAPAPASFELFKPAKTKSVYALEDRQADLTWYIEQIRENHEQIKIIC